MTRVLPRTHFHSSRLVRVLADLAAVKAAPTGVALAEHLGLWVDYTDAITLCAVHNAGASSASAPPGAPAMGSTALAEEVKRLRAALEQSITSSSVPPLETDGSNIATARELGAAFEPYRRYYQAQQRDMQLAITALRAKVREALARTSPALRQLAALDAAFENILRERETRLLSGVPNLLRQRFAQWLKTQTGAPAAATRSPKAPPTGFGKELHSVLLAELDLRLQTTQGLVEALHQEKPTTP